MDWLTFFSNLISSLAWPFTTLILIFTFIYKSNEIAKTLKSIKYKDFELILRDELVVAKELAAKVESRGELAKKTKSLSLDDPEFLKLAELDISLAVLKIWQELELKVTQLIQHNGLVRFTNSFKFISKLKELGKINQSDVDLFNQLRKIRNEVVHSSPYGYQVKMSKAELLEYKRFVEVFVERLEAIGQEDGYIDIE